MNGGRAGRGAGACTEPLAPKACFNQINGAINQSREIIFPTFSTDEEEGGGDEKSTSLFFQ